MLTEERQSDPTITSLYSIVNKEYFYFKNSVQTDEEPSSRDELHFVFDLIDKQHLLIQAFEQKNRELINELSFRKMIIENKSQVLRELNSVVVNKFIDRNYQQEILITFLKAENDELKKNNKKLINQPITSSVMNTITTSPTAKRLCTVASVPSFAPKVRNKGLNNGGQNNNVGQGQSNVGVNQGQAQVQVQAQSNVVHNYSDKGKNTKTKPHHPNIKSNNIHPTLGNPVNVSYLIDTYKIFLNSPKLKLSKKNYLNGKPLSPKNNQGRMNTKQ